MLVRADQLSFGDHLRDGEVVWVLSTLDQRYVVVGLRPWRRTTVGAHPAHVSRRYWPDESLERLNPG